MLLHPTYPYIKCDLTLGLAACLHTPFPCDPLWPLALFSLLLNVCPWPPRRTGRVLQTNKSPLATSVSLQETTQLFATWNLTVSHAPTAPAAVGWAAGLASAATLQNVILQLSKLSIWKELQLRAHCTMLKICSHAISQYKKQFFKWKGVDDWSSIMIFPQWHCLFHLSWYVVSKSVQVKYLSHSLESPLHPCLNHITADQNTEIAVTFLKTCSLATVHSWSLRKIDVYDECGNPTWAQDKIFFSSSSHMGS